MSDTPTIQPTPASDLKAGSKKVVTNADTGHTFRIRKVSTFDLWAEGVLTSEPVAPTDGAAAGEYPRVTEEVRVRASSFERALLCRGVDSVRVVPGTSESESSNTVGILDLDPADRTFLRHEILVFSGLAAVREDGEESAMAERFQGGKQASDGPADTPAGDDVPRSPEPHPQPAA